MPYEYKVRLNPFAHVLAKKGGHTQESVEVQEHKVDWPRFEM